MRDCLVFVTWCLPFVGAALGHWWSFAPLFLFVSAISRELAEILGVVALATVSGAIVSAAIASSVFGSCSFDLAFAGIFIGTFALAMAGVIAKL